MPSVEPLLFDPDELPPKPFNGSLIIRPTRERPLSKEERAFNRAVAKVQALRARFDEEKRRLDRALVFQATELRQRFERVTALRTALVRGFAPFLDDRRLKPAQKKTLGAILNEQLNEMQRNSGGGTVTEDESAYSVAVHVPDAPDAADWTAQVTGPPHPGAVGPLRARGRTGGFPHHISLISRNPVQDDGSGAA